MTQGSNNLHFFYGAGGSPAIVEFNGVSYGYVKNLQGDVIAIVNASGTKVVEYTYDAWGRPLSKSGSMASTLGTLNPFRYRGYVYDEETGLYYLRSRYYNPTWGRFVNADGLVNHSHILTINLFAYCMNNPVINFDKSGYAAVCCFDENGNLTTFMQKFMGGGVGWGGGVMGGYAVVNTVYHMDKEDWIDEFTTLAIVGLSIYCSGYIMKVAHILGKALLAESVTYGTGKGIGYFLYGVMVANGLGLSYGVDKTLHSAVGKEVEPPSETDFLTDLACEFVPIEISTAVEFLISYVEEYIDMESVWAFCKKLF